MRTLFFLFSLLWFSSLGAQSKIVGFVKLQSSGDQVLSNAELWAIGCASLPERFSNSKGYFELEFPNKSAGDIIKEISVTLEGYEVVNKKKLKTYGLLKRPTDNPLVVVMCKQGDYRKAAGNYYATIYQQGEAELQAEKAKLEKQLAEERNNREALETQLAAINEKLTNLPQVAEAAANYFAKIDLDQATQLQKAALAALDKGDIAAALDAMPEELMDQNMAAAQQRKQQLESELAATNKVIEQTIENYIFKAQLYVSQGDYPAAERLYEKGIAADTTNMDHLYDYVVFLEDINRYEKALVWLQQLINSTDEAWQRANAYGLMGQVYEEIGDFDRAPVAYGQYYFLFDSLYTQNKTNDFYKNGLAISYSKLGDIYQAQGKVDTALVFFQKRSQLGEELYRDNPKSESLKNGLAISYEKLGAIYQAQGKFDTALVFFQKRSQLGEELYRDNPKSESLKNGLAISYEKLGAIYQAQGKFDTALVFFQKQTDLFEDLYRDNPKSESLKNGLAISYEKLGAIYQAQGKFDTALVFFQKQTDLFEDLYRDNPKSEKLKNGLAISYSKLGDIYQAQGKVDTALVFFQKRSQLGEELYRDNPKSEKLKNGLAISYSKLGDIYQAQGKVDTALVFFQKETDLFQELYRDNPKSESLKNGLAISYSKLGDIYQAQGKVDTALVFFQKDLSLTEELYRDNPKSESLKNGLAISYSKLGDIYQAQGKVDTALVFFQKETDLFQELYRDNPKSMRLWEGVGISYYKLGALYAELEDTEKALEYYQKALAEFQALSEFTGLPKYERFVAITERDIQKLEEPPNPVLERITELQQLVNDTEIPAEKVKYQEKLLDILQKLVDAAPDNTKIKAYVANEYGGMAWYYLFTKQFEEAEQAARKGIQLGGEGAEWVHTNLALALLYQGKYEAAKAIYQRYSGQPYPSNEAEKQSWTDIFLKDLKDLEAEGITHSDVEKIRAFFDSKALGDKNW